MNAFAIAYVSSPEAPKVPSETGSYVLNYCQQNLPSGCHRNDN
jgi:hypothetical protein